MSTATIENPRRRWTITSAAADRVNAISKQNHGAITPDMVIADAKDPESPLHRYFEWDVDKAALQHWRERARWIITEVKVQVTIHRKSITSFAYVRNPDAEGDEQGYLSIENIRSDKRLAQDTMIEELTRMKSILFRCSTLADVLAVNAQLRRVRDSVASLRQHVEDI